MTTNSTVFSSSTTPGLHSILPATALLLALLVCTTSVHAQVFKWVGPDGKTNYSDVPPAPSVRAERKALAGNVVDVADMPFQLAESAKASPVTLYTGEKCAGCDEGRKLLVSRGIPFTEKTVSTNADIALLGNGKVELPQLLIGASKQVGFEAGAWNTGLSAAGYPETNRLPKGYRNPAPASAAPAGAGNETDSAAPAASSVTAPAVARKPARVAPPKPAASSVPGLRF